MKRFLLALLAGLLTAVALAAPRPSQASGDDANVVLHKRIYRDARLSQRPDFDWAYESGTELTLDDDSFGLNGAHFRIYDATALLAPDDVDAAVLAERFAQMTCRQAIAYAEDHDLPLAGHNPDGSSGELVTQTVTKADGTTEDGYASFTVPKQVGGRWAAYLIIETKVDADKLLNVDLDKKAVPILLVFPTVENETELDEVHIYPKNVGYVRDPYFFKYGVTTSGEQVRLAGAIFALYQYDDAGRKMYLDQSPVNDLKNSWVYTDDPLNHPKVELFIADKNGLVNTGPRFLPSGIYYFEELKSVPGYTNNLGEHGVKVEIPDSWTDDDGNFRPVLVNGEPLIETLEGDVTAEALALGRPRVYNYQQATTTPTTPKPGVTTAGPGSPGKPGFLPGLGEASTWLAMGIGLLLMLTTYWLLRRKERQRA